MTADKALSHHTLTWLILCTRLSKRFLEVMGEGKAFKVELHVRRHEGWKRVFLAVEIGRAETEQRLQT